MTGVDTTNNPPKELPLAVRKNIRDEFLSKSADLLSRIQASTGLAFTFKLDWLTIYKGVADDHYLKGRIGEAMYWYFDNLATAIDSHVKNDEMVHEAFEEATKNRTLSFAYVDKVTSYNELVFADGDIYVTTIPANIGTNAYQIGHSIITDITADKKSPVQTTVVAKEPPVSNASDIPKSLPLAVRKNVRDEWANKQQALVDRVKTALQLDVKFVVNYDALYKSIPADNHYRDRMGEVLHWYFEALVGNMESLCKDDDMCREACQEALERGEVGIELVDKLPENVYYNDIRVVDGAFWVITEGKNWGTNCYQTGRELVNRL